MANDILNSEIFQTQTSEKKTISTKPTTETKKEGSSLFDNLLKDAQTKADKESISKVDLKNTVQNSAQKISKSTNTQLSTTKELVSKGSESNIKNITSEDTTKNISTVSSNLANNLEVVKEKITHQKVSIDSKEAIKTNSAETTTTGIISQKSLIEPENKLINKIVPKTNENQKQVEQKGTLSLLDKMMQDLKKETPSGETIVPLIEPENKLTDKIASKTPIQVKDGVAEATTINKKTEVSIELPKNSIKEKVQKEVIKSETQEKIVTTSNTSIDKENPSLKSEISRKKSPTTTSLLDQMVQSIVENNIETKEEKIEEKGESKKTEHKTVAKNDETVGKLFAELTNGIKLDNGTQIETTHTKSNLKVDSKETKILSSLADSLSGKTKLQKKADEVTKFENLQDSKAQFGANMFLSNQKVQAELLSQQKLSEAKDLLKDGEKTTKTVKKSADILELKPKNIEITTEDEKSVVATKQMLHKANEVGVHNQQNFLNRIFLNKENGNQSIDTKVLEEQIVQTKIVTEDTKKISQDISITVERNLVETFTTKVIASKQMMGSFMSDVARNMYLNYKPPITAFKINLDPINLGNIAIVMKNNKTENTLSISLNMSQNATYDTFNDNKSALQNALGKVFNQNEGNVSLNFGMQSDSSNQEFEQHRQNEENKQIIQNRIHKDNAEEFGEQATIELETTKSYM